jgi:hypothetical protein
VKRADDTGIAYIPRSDATPRAEISALATVYTYLINTHNSEKAVECAATSDDRDGLTKVRTQSKEAT